MLFAYSSERRGAVGAQLGTAHYSYRFVEDAFARLCQNNGIANRLINYPESFKHPAHYEKVLGVGPDRTVHVAFRSTENIRPMHGAINISHFAWEFDVLKHDAHVFEPVHDNQLHMLALMDEIWVSCSYTRDILSQNGLSRVHLVPPPVIAGAPPRRPSRAEAIAAVGWAPSLPLAVFACEAPVIDAAAVRPLIAPLSERVAEIGERGRVFLTVLNPNDLRKNLVNILDAFAMAQDAAGARDLLIVKSILANRDDYRSYGLLESLLPRIQGPAGYFDDRIAFVFDYLEPEEMDCLYGLADYYISAAHCEGFNLPLTQAMASGAVPVATRNTAMLDYIDDENAIVIAERRFVSPIPNMAAEVANRSFEIDFADRFDIARAIRRAMSQTPTQRRAMAERAVDAISSRYSEAACLRRLRERLDALSLLRAVPA